MPNNEPKNRPTTNDASPLPLPVYPRPSIRVDGHVLKACICTIPYEDRAGMATATSWDKQESPWMPDESCKCGGTGWICATCRGGQWILERRGEFPRCKDTLRVCASCSEPNSNTEINSAVIFQPWMVKFRNQKSATHPVKLPVLPSVVDLKAEQERRAEERGRVLQEMDDNWESERVYEMEETGVYA